MSKPKKKTKKTLPQASLAKANPLYAKLLSFEPRRRDLRKAMIVEAAIQCIHKFGVEETHFESIGKMSGMGRAHVKYYFKDRNDIVKAAIEFVATTAQMVTLECISRATTPKGRLLAFIEGTFRWAEQYPEHLSVMGLNYYYCSIDSEYRKVHTEIRRLGEQRATAIVQECLPKLSKAEAALLGKNIQNLILGNVLDWGTTRSENTLETVHQVTVVAVKKLLAGF